MSKRPKEMTSRHTAIRCLTKWSAGREPIQPLIDSIINQSDLAPADRHLGVMMVQGVLRQMQYLDYVISRFAKHPLEKMKPLLLMALRVGVYQLFFLDRIPDSAAVNETVKVLKAEKQPRWIVNFANGVLRSISRKKNELWQPAQPDGNEMFFHNHPDWLISRWEKRYGKESTREICRVNNQEPYLTLRVNLLAADPDTFAGQLSDAGIEVRKGKYEPGALIIPSLNGPVSSLPGYAEGHFHVQDEAAQLVTLLLGPYSKGTYLDGCAGLGGKTVMLAQLVPNEAELIAVEPNGHRFQLLQENVKRMAQDSRVTAVKGMLGELLPDSRAAFQGVLVDAPCSGTGVIRRHPDIRWNRQQKDLESYRAQQLELLEQAAELVKPGGILVYATCSMEPEENELVVDTFLAKHPGYSVTNAGEFLPEPAACLVTREGYFSSTPADGLDGFFGARLQRS